MDHLTVHYSSSNGSYHHVTALREGHTHINASLAPLRHPDTGEVWKQEVGPVAKRQQMEIYGPIVVHPPLLVLLWVDEKVEVPYKYLLKVRSRAKCTVHTSLVASSRKVFKHFFLQCIGTHCVLQRWN